MAQHRAISNGKNPQGGGAATTNGTSAAPEAAVNPFGARARRPLANPFASPLVATGAATSDARTEGAEGSDYYALIAAAPSVPAAEVESSAPAIEVMVLWGERDILHVAHLDPPRAFVVGESGADAAEGAAPDFAMEATFLGAPRMVVAGPEAGATVAYVPVGGRISVRRGPDLVSHESLANAGELRASSSVPGALEYRLRDGETARIAHKGFHYQVKSVAAGRVVGTRLRPDTTMLGYVAAVGTFVLGTALGVSFLMPEQGSLGGDALDLDNRYVQALIQSAEQPPPERPDADRPTTGGSGQAARGPAGEMGHPDQAHTGRRSATEGNAPREEWHTGRQTAEEAAQNNVVTNAVATLAAMFSAGPSSEYSPETAVGGDAMSALGNLLGAQIGSSGGAGGLGMAGTGLGSGGTGIGTYGMGNDLGTLGRTGGTGTGDRYGAGGGDGLAERGPVVPRVTAPGVTHVEGGLTADQIRRVIQRNVSQVQHCYEQGLQRNPGMAGRVAVRFMIMPTGTVGGSTVSDNSVGDSTVGTCIAGAVRRWQFPQPDPAGPVAVTFPFNLSSSGGH